MPIQCISYLDEAKTDLGVNRYYTIASLTATKDDYFEIIEPQWISLRKKYDIPDGQNIHFTEIKLLLGNNSRNYKHPWIHIFQGQHIG